MVSRNSAIAIAAIRSILVTLALVNPAVSLSRPIPFTTRSGDRSAGVDVGGVHTLQKNNGISSTALRLRGGGELSDKLLDSTELKSYASEASTLFGNLRVPAALFAGASAGAAFAMPINAAVSEGLIIGSVKRFYSLLMITSLASQIVVVSVSTGSIEAMALGFVQKTKCVGDLLDLEYALEWITVRFCFLGGLGCFIFASGLRAWVTVACPVFAKACLGVIISATLLCLAFVKDTLRYGSDNLLVNIPIRFAKLLFQRAKKEGMFALALGTYLITCIYIVIKAPHLWKYLAVGNNCAVNKIVSASI